MLWSAYGLVRFSPEAAGSGLPEVKCILRSSAEFGAKVGIGVEYVRFLGSQKAGVSIIKLYIVISDVGSYYCVVILIIVVVFSHFWVEMFCNWGGIELGNFLKPRVLLAKSFGLMLVLGASMPVGKDRWSAASLRVQPSRFFFLCLIDRSRYYMIRLMCFWHVSFFWTWRYLTCNSFLRDGFKQPSVTYSNDPKKDFCQEGPFVHIASCISALLLPLSKQFGSRLKSHGKSWHKFWLILRSLMFVVLVMCFFLSIEAEKLNNCVCSKRQIVWRGPVAETCQNEKWSKRWKHCTASCCIA